MDSLEKKFEEDMTTLLELIKELGLKYDQTYISTAFVKDQQGGLSVWANNNYWEENENMPINIMLRSAGEKDNDDSGDC